MNVKRIFLAGTILIAAASGAKAATFEPTSVQAQYGTCAQPIATCGGNNRLNPLNAADGNLASFYSLGLEGSILLGFAIPGNASSKTISIFETTFGRPRISRNLEAADIYAVNGATEVFIGRITNLLSESILVTSLPFSALRLVDVTRQQFPNTTSGDGFDVAGVSIEAAVIPLPATGLMLLGGLGGLAALRRRRKAA